MSLAALLAAAAAGVVMSVEVALPPATPSGTGAVPVRLILDQMRYAPGAEGQVRVEVGKDGFLLVLYADPDGHVRIAYPLDPGLSGEVTADTEIDIVSRGARGAFFVEDSSGSGTWYAAIASRPFSFDSIAINGHWDYRAIPRVENPQAVESELTEFVKWLSRGRFDYDIVSFVIDTAAGRTSSTLPPGAYPAPAPGARAPEPIFAPPIWRSPWLWPGWTGPWAGPYYDGALPTVTLTSGTQLARGPDFGPAASNSPYNSSRERAPATAPAHHGEAPATSQGSGSGKSSGHGKA